MPSAEEKALLGAVREHLGALETLCGEIERSLVARRWERVDTAIADSRRVAHAFQNAFEAAQEQRDAQFDEEISRRLRYVFAVHENQVARLKQYRSTVGERLESVGRWKQMLRSFANRANPRISNLDQVS